MRVKRARLPGLLLGVVDGGVWLLERRVMALLERRVVWGWRGRMVCAAVCVAVMAAASVGLGMVAVRGSVAQEVRGAVAGAAFEVAAIRPTDPNVAAKHDMGVLPYADRVLVRDQTARELIVFAYDIQSKDQLSGGPGWMDDRRYDIDATIAPSFVAEFAEMKGAERTAAVRTMMRGLLEKRFHLVLATEPRELPAYALVVAKGGAKLTPTTAESGAAPILKMDSSRMVSEAVSMRDLAEGLTKHAELGGRVVVDRTGLTGRYDVALAWTPNEGLLDAAGPARDSSSLMEALEKQLGLRLQSTRARVDGFVVRGIEQPGGN
jgi:uncharacterized protein (TIGR03435 family)